MAPSIAGSPEGAIVHQGDTVQNEWYIPVRSQPVALAGLNIECSRLNRLRLGSFNEMDEVSGDHPEFAFKNCDEAVFKAKRKRSSAGC